MQVGEVDQCRQYLGLETDAGLVETVAATQDQLLQIFHTILVAPEHVNGFANSPVVVVDDGHLAVNARLHGDFMQRHRAGGYIFFLEIDLRKSNEVFVFWHGWRWRFALVGYFDFGILSHVTKVIVHFFLKIWRNSGVYHHQLAHYTPRSHTFIGGFELRHGHGSVDDRLDLSLAIPLREFLHHQGIGFGFAT